MTVQDGTPAGLGPIIAEGEWAGWSTWTGSEPFEEYIGPFYTRRDENGRWITGCRIQPKNMNGAGSVHGGSLMSFADYSLFMIAMDDYRGQSAVTVTLNGEFLNGAPVGSVIMAMRPTLGTSNGAASTRAPSDSASLVVSSLLATEMYVDQWAATPWACRSAPIG